MCTTGRAVWLLVLGVIIALPGGRASFAQPAREPSRDEAEVIRDLRSLVAAVRRGDAAGIKRYLHPGETPLQQEGRDTIAELIAAQKELERAAERSFGAEGRRLRCGFDLIVTDGDLNALQEAEVSFIDELARVIRVGETTAMYLRRPYVPYPGPGKPLPPPGPWQLRLEQIGEMNEDNAPGPRTGDTLPKMHFDRYQAMLKATRDVLAGLGRGDFTTAAAAEERLAQHYRQAASEYQARRAAWQERRWGGGRRGGGGNR